jgi:hypothetical protein
MASLVALMTVPGEGERGPVVRIGVGYVGGCYVFGLNPIFPYRIKQGFIFTAGAVLLEGRGIKSSS